MSAAEADAAATAVHRLAALVAGGLGLDRARAVLGVEADGLQAGAGGGLVSAVLEAAAETGAPMAPALERLAALLRDAAAQERVLAAALAGPRATARMVALLPLVGIGFGMALGLDVVGAVVSGGLALWSMIAGLVLLGAAQLWSRAILRRAAAGERAPGLALELVAVALAGGGSPDRARSLAVAALPEVADWSEVDAALDLARRAGVPVRGLLLAEAETARVRARLDAEARAQRAAVHLTLPLGLCVLPAFLLLAVVPLVLSMLDGALSPLG